jgi:pimeloyl-ACP methyl ester carboxylesterase
MIAHAMRRTRRALILSLSAALPLAMLPFVPVTALAQAAPALKAPVSKAPAVCATPSAPIIEEGFVNIGGIDQWVTIHGARCDNPIILFVHGGPGNALSPYSKAIYGAWEKDFTIVHWDQRGAGQTFLRNPGTVDTTLTMEQLAADGVAVANYVTGHLHQPKVILLGGSWGSALGVTMAQLKPELFSAYIGIGQMVNYREGIIASYNKTLGLARAAGDTDTVAKLDALGTPPWTNPRNSGVLRRATRVYEAKTALPAPKAWWAPEAQYATPQYEAAAEAADDYSYVQFVGMTGKGMASRLDLPALGLTFKMPVYIFAGDADLVTVPELARRYFDRIVAPHKEFIPVPQAGHDPNAPLVDAEFKLLKTRLAHPARVPIAP